MAGGFLVAATTLAGRSSSAVPAMTTLLFLVGVGAGVAHGGLLAYLGRDPTRTRGEALGTLLWAGLALPLALLLAWVCALWVSLTAAVLRGSSSSLFQVGWLVLAWVGGAAVCIWALWVGLRGAAAALRRWRDVRVAAVIATLVFAVLATAFLASPPEIWFTDLRVNSLGAVILAFGASVWIALPVMIAFLGLMHRLRRRPAA